MAAGPTVGENQLQRIIRDLHEAVAELANDYKESGEPITDDSTNLHKFSYKLEYLLQFDQKEKTTFLGTKKDYWDYFHDCLAKIKGANDGIRFVKSITELKTSLGKGRAFIRYSLVHQRLADTLQQCLMNQRVTSDWYYARSPFLKPQLSADIINHLYELNEIQFDVASRGHDLDSSWPTFARRTLGSANSPGHMWKPPSRSSSINSLASTYSQQAHEFPSSPDYGQGLLNDLNESLPACVEDVSTVEALRLELDQSELRQQGLLDKMQQLSDESSELRGVVTELQKQLDVSLAAQEKQKDLLGELKALREREEVLSRKVETLRTEEKAKDAQNVSLQEKLVAAESKNIELLAKLDSILNEKGQQAASHFDSAQKIHELLDNLKEAEKGKMEAIVEMEEKKRLVEELEKALSIKEEAVKASEVKLNGLISSGNEEKTKLEAKVEEQCRTLEKLQGSLTLREKEVNNLQRQLQDLQKSQEEKEKELENIKKKAQDDRDELQKNSGHLKESLEAEIAALVDQLESKREEVISFSKTIEHLENKNQSLTIKVDEVASNLAEHENKIKEQDVEIEDYKTKCASLTELKEKMMTTALKNEELQKEMTKNKAALEAELATLRASEKQLRGQIDDTKMTVDEKEKSLREENRKLDESLQRATMAAEQSETTSKRLEKENLSLQQEQDTVKAALCQMQADLKSVHGQIGELEKNLGASRKNEASLKEKLQDKEAELSKKEMDFLMVTSQLEALQEKEKELETARAAAEATCAEQSEMIKRATNEKQALEMSQLDRNAVQAKENQEVTDKLIVVESQLEINLKEVSRLQAEMLDLKVQLQRSEEEKLKSQTQLEVTEAQRDELRSLTEQLKSQTEVLNQKHIAELMESKKKEEALIKQLDQEVAAHGELAISAAAVREELFTLKAENNKLALESNETRDSLHRANTEMAELGMTICKLSAEKEEATEQWADNTTQIEELEKRMSELMKQTEELLVENSSLQKELAQRETLPETITKLQEQLKKKEEQVQSIKDSCREEIEAVKFQMSSESMNHQVQMKSVTDQLENLNEQLQLEQKSVSSLQPKISELEAMNAKYFDLIGEKDAYITKIEATIRENEDEIQQLRKSITSAEEEQLARHTVCEELKQKLKVTEADKQSQYLKLSAEIDDLNRTKTNLEERLIELIKDKDALWQKSDALEFEQKLRAEERWWLVDKEATHCLGCQGQFSWWFRRHHCRLCGRIFCYHCSNNFVMTKQSGKKERCCRDCYTHHSVAVESSTETELDGQSSPPLDGSQTLVQPTPRVSVSEPSSTSDDGAFDIITEEEVNGVYDSDSTSQTTGGSLEGEQDQRHQGVLELGAANVTPDEEHVSTVQDSEIYLLKSGEVTMAVPLSIEDIAQFGDGSRELFIKSSCYSVITVAVNYCGPTISWVFSSEPKSISFSVVYRESSEIQAEQSKVLIPLTRCNSHKETIQGQLKVRHPGLYLLIFDNSFSRFISKKVFYHLTMEKPVIYDGSDGP